MSRDAKTMTCAKCGEAYVCDPGGDCWCMHTDIKLPMPANQDAKCLCPCELRQLAAQQQADKTHA